MSSLLSDARRVVAEYLESTGRRIDAVSVLSGGGDDFVEMRVAQQVLARTAARLARFEHALACYADETFWDGDHPEASLAFHDGGEIARAALAGRNPCSPHRD